MARPQVVTTLERKYARLLGLQSKLPSACPALAQDIAHVAAVIRMFEPDWDQSSVKPVMYRGPARWAKKGQGSRAAMEVVRHADRPLSATEIARAAYLHCGLEPPHNNELRLVGADLAYSLRRHFGGALVASGKRPVRYRLRKPD